LRPSEIAPALWDLMWAGQVSNDSLAPALDPRPDAVKLERRRRTPWGGGRWSVPPIAPDGAVTVEQGLRLLFDRYGILCRELVKREEPIVAWRDAYPILSRMEWRGEADRGLLVSGLSGLQFAAPGVADGLQAVRSDGEFAMVPTSDPANVWGDVVPLVGASEERLVVRRQPGSFLIFQGGVPILLVEGHGARLTPIADLMPQDRRGGLAQLAHLVEGHLRRQSIRVTTWSGMPVADSPAAGDLESLGFMREDRDMVLYRTFRGRT